MTRNGRKLAKHKSCQFFKSPVFIYLRFSFAGHKIPISKSAPVQQVGEFGDDTYNPFLQSVTKNIRILPAANQHNLQENEIDTTEKIIDIVNENEFVDDIFLDMETDESFEQFLDQGNLLRGTIIWSGAA